MAQRRAGIVLILGLLVGAFLVLDGIAGILEADSMVSRIAGAFNSSGRTIAIVVAIVELVAGAMLLLSQFLSLGQLESVLKIGILIAWVVVIVLVLFVGGANVDSLAWWRSLVQYAIILVAIWVATGDR
jgi:hypothetical protein